MARGQSDRNTPETESFVIPDTPIALSIAGSDCSAGAGIQADLKVFAAFGIYGLTAVSAVVAETPNKLVEFHAVSARILEAQVRVLMETYPVAAMKTGMLPESEPIHRIAPLLQAWKAGSPRARLVVDPVILASTSGRLMDAAALKALKEVLVPLADLITPNYAEAATLLGEASGRSVFDSSSAIQMATALADKFETAILLKGGHSPDPDRACDILVSEIGQTEYSVSRIPGGETLHGTGCSLSSAITAGLCRGLTLEDAVGEAKTFLVACMERAHHWEHVSALRVEALPGGSHSENLLQPNYITFSDRQ